MTIEAKIIADSVNPWTGDRLTTMQLRYPRFVHAECKTHRLLRIDDAEVEFLQEISLMDDPDLSRNASSSRAIPVKNLIAEARTNPAMPVRFGANQPGMQDKGGDHDALIRGETAEELWKRAAASAAMYAEAFEAAGYHKQVVNRILEPYTHINTVVSATEWTNFFALRRHEDADPTMRALADTMWEAMQGSTPRALFMGEWHLPYVSDEERRQYDETACLMMSTARCARVSYNKHDGTSPSYEDDRKLYDRLVTAELIHASPLEHQGYPDPAGVQEHLWGNFHGFVQHRKLLPNEVIK